jgi:hypothetical protein
MAAMVLRNELGAYLIYRSILIYIYMILQYVPMIDIDRYYMILYDIIWYFWEGRTIIHELRIIPSPNH